MCGIFGIFSHTRAGVVDQQRLNQTACLLEHRGPDHRAVFADERVGLVHTRLALIDLEPRSNQPFWSRDRRYCLVFNGEIYNFRELREELEADGVAFRTTSDTEVLLESILHKGLESMLPRLEGMFAFALYDATKGSLSLARDRFGIKPLYVYDQDDAFIFASEVRALRPWLRLEPDMLSISSYLHGFGGPTSGHSLYRNVTIVPPGTVVLVTPGRRGCHRRFCRMQDLWEPDEVARLRRVSSRRLVDAVEERLFESVRMQLVADVPVGVLCSGGLDSSLISAMAARILHGNVSLFHADVVGPMSEVDAATAVARHLKLSLESVKVHDQDSIDNIPEIMQHYGQPFTYHPNSVPFLMVSQLVRRNRIKAILSGEGADECYVGYPWLIFNVRERLLGSTASLRSAYRLPRRGFRRRNGDGAALADDGLGSLARALHNRFESDVDAEDMRRDLGRRTGRTPTDHDLVTLDQLGYQLRTLLHRNDSLGMAAGIEARFPFLNTGLVRLAVNLPYNTKVRLSPCFDSEHYFLRDKWVLREVAARYLPTALARQKKRGFPIQAHQRMHIKPEFFDDSFVADAFSLSRRELDYLVRHAGQSLRQKLLHLEVWAGVCLNAMPPAEMSARLQKCVSLA